MEERRKAFRRQSDIGLQKKLQEFEQWHGDAPAKECRKRRRRAVRHHCTVQVGMRMAHRSSASQDWSVENHPIKGRLLDFSHDGCLIFTSQLLDVNQQLSLAVAMRSGSRLNIDGVVRWTKSVPQRQGFASGVHFLPGSVQDQQLLQHFARELDETVGL